MSALTELLDQKLQEHFDGNASELARVVGTSQQNISNWLSGDVIKPSYWRKAARALGVPEDTLEGLINLAVTEHGPDKPKRMSTEELLEQTMAELQTYQRVKSHLRRKPPLPPNATIASHQPVVTTNKMLPVLGMAVGGDDGKYIFNGSIIDYVACPPSLENVAGAYAVYIDGESMFPRFKAGETVWVHPGKPARRGDDVIVQIKPEDDDGSPPWGYVKEYVGRQGNKLVLRQYNPATEIEFDIEDVLTTHPIVLAGKY